MKNQKPEIRNGSGFFMRSYDNTLYDASKQANFYPSTQYNVVSKSQNQSPD
ncbi:MAG: hypothetical protein Q7U54_05800 [Bacteroidales bacterium]|nr:hypothetical protein [Bacteroidales bacterium]